MSSSKITGRSCIAIGTVALSLVVAGCAGSLGNNAGSNDSGGSGEGYEYGASPDEIKAAFADIDPITVTFQPAAQSPDAPGTNRPEKFIENLETLSDGKITVDTTYAQGIASYAELPDALADGRVDVGYMTPIYLPDRFPRYNAWTTATTLTGTSPLVDELAANAAIGQLTWQDEELVQEFREQGIEPLNLFNASGAIFSMCTDEHESAEDWQGNQVRASSAAQSAQLGALNASPVSLAYTETFEALQRNTIDCTLSSALAATGGGLLEVATHASYTTDVSFARGPGGLYAGSAWDSWPLAVQQLMFDSMKDEFAQSRRDDLETNAHAAEVVREQGGSFREMDGELQRLITEASEGLVKDEEEKGYLPAGATESVPATVEEWKAIVGELGYEDEGTFANYDEWYPVDDEAFLDPVGERYYEEVMLPHRPSQS